MPNPNIDIFAIKSTTEDSYQLINNLGQTIKNIQLKTNNNFTNTINELSQGVYALVGKENNLIVSQKIIVIK